MIIAPKEDKKRSIARALAEAILGELPISGAIMRIFEETHPSKYKVEIEQWRRGLTDRVNEHDTVLNKLTQVLEPTIKISDHATAVALAICRLSESGLPDPVPLEAIATNTPELSMPQVESALYELQELRFVSTKPGLIRIRPTLDLFRAFDPAVFETVPDQDAKQLARAVLDNRSLQNVRLLHQHTGWTLRRFNPALCSLLEHVNQDLISREIQPDYPTTHFSLDGGSEFHLKRLAGLS